ncbi:MAG: hypothetical protein Q8873_03010 [Bacillota bacterium]|nr:hypothetical protein [Bacillota bacterium]
MSNYSDPLEENYYALYLAIVYPYTLTADEAFYAIQNGLNPLKINEQTVLDGLRLSEMKKEPLYFRDESGRRYEIIRLMAGMIQEANLSMKGMRDYELEKYREKVVSYMEYLRLKMEGERIR